MLEDEKTYTVRTGFELRQASERYEEVALGFQPELASSAGGTR